MFLLAVGCGFVFLLAVGFRAVVRCGEEDETVVWCVAFDKGGSCHGEIRVARAWCRYVEEDGGGCCVSSARMIGFGSILTRGRNGTLWLQVTTEAKRGAFWSHPNMPRF